MHSIMGRARDEIRRAPVGPWRFSPSEAKTLLTSPEDGPRRGIGARWAGLPAGSRSAHLTREGGERAADSGRASGRRQARPPYVLSVCTLHDVTFPVRGADFDRDRSWLVHTLLRSAVYTSHMYYDTRGTTVHRAGAQHKIN